MVYSLLALARRSVETELHFVEAVGEAKDWEVGALNHGDGLVALIIIFLALIVSCDWYEMSELLRGQKIIQNDALIQFMVESDLVESFFKVPT